MGDNVAIRSTVAGIVIGGLISGSMWWLDVSLVAITATGVVWAAAVGSSLYVFEAYDQPRDAGPWGAVVGGSLSFGVVLNLSEITIPNSSAAALTVLAMGFTLLGYAAGMATVHRQKSGR